MQEKQSEVQAVALSKYFTTKNVKGIYASFPHSRLSQVTCLSAGPHPVTHQGFHLAPSCLTHQLIPATSKSPRVSGRLFPPGHLLRH